MLRSGGVGVGALWFIVVLLVIIAGLLVVIAVRLLTAPQWRSHAQVRAPGPYGPYGPVQPGPSVQAGPVPPMPGHAPAPVPPGPGLSETTAPLGPVPPGPAGSGEAGVSRAKQILDQRLASGEISPELYRELRQALE
jgi:uncharacterized membrane protein